jgi:hypothetical protein
MAGGLPQTAGGAVGATSATAASAGGNLRGLNAADQLTSASSGVIGMNGMNLTSAAANSTQGSRLADYVREAQRASVQRYADALASKRQLAGAFL